MDTAAALDPDTQRVVWGWGPGTLDHPHSPVMLPDGEILVFDNGMGEHRRAIYRMVRYPADMVAPLLETSLSLRASAH
jgi:hypothetical protein